MMQAVQDNGAECVRAAIAALGARTGAFRVEMDSGPVIVVQVALDPALRRARIDFTGTSAAGGHNFNAPRAVCITAVLYVFRLLHHRGAVRIPHAGRARRHHSIVSVAGVCKPLKLSDFAKGAL